MTNGNDNPGATSAWPVICVMGAGAVGAYFGGILARAGAPVTLIGREQHVDAISREGLVVDSIHFHESIRLSATTDAASASNADVILFCVKTLDTESAARQLAPHVKPNAIVLSMQNGVDNADKIEIATGIRVLSAVVYVASRFTAPGQLKHSGRGDLIIGEDLPDARAGDSLVTLQKMFERARVPCRISDNIRGELWAKLITNCAYNPTCALAQSNYHDMLESPLIRDLMTAVVEESVAVAGADGVRIPDGDILNSVLKLAETMGGAVSSTAQDLARGKATEIDSLNGYVVRRGRKLGIATPVNSTLYALTKQLEKEVTRVSRAVTG